MMSSNVHEDEIEEETLTNEILNNTFKFDAFKYKQSGSSAENLYLPFSSHVKSDIDLMFEFPYIYAADPDQLTLADREQYEVDHKIRFLYVDYSNKKYPCYIKLYFNSTKELIQVSEETDASFVLPDTNINMIVRNDVEPHRKYFPSVNFVNWFAKKWPVDNFNGENLEIHGPSICITSNHPALPLPVDHVASLKCIHWPKPAFNWINRVRSSHWPDQNLINFVVKSGCHIVPISHVSTNDGTKKIEWRLSFSMCEIILAKTLNCYQRKCYLIVKALFDVHIKQDFELSKTICSYFLKTMLFWLCESIGKEKWTYETLYDRFIDFIDHAIECFERKYLGHYFIAEMNLIDHIDHGQLKKMIDRCISIKHDLLNKIKICEEHYWNSNQFIRFNPIIEVLSNNESLADNSCIIWCCANTMRALIMQDKSIDRPLKMVHDCIKRNYLQTCSDESAKYLLYVTSLISHRFEDENVYSPKNLSTHDAMIKICEAKSIYDQSYQDMKENYIEIQNHLKEDPSVSQKLA
ncbi:unnamed protein product [Rotaria magnacalcarata]|uniref:Mab-21-like HhH/H2TH-like domain-containing protein n=3 Tax=Rotaria magnacalcarata TaxID=392030 RepID=A0A816QSL4_9BILA|nr:unnamed protein product [Rotaria magnacalcarata]